MKNRKIKTNWLFILIVTVLASIVGGGSLYMKNAWLSVDSLASISTKAQQVTGLDPNFLNQVNDCFFPVAAVYGYTLRITSGYRSATQQEQIYSQGRTVNGHIVTWAEPGHSMHNYGFAIDVVDRWRGYNIDWVKLGKIGAYCGLTQVDDPHFEYRGGLNTAQFEAGLRPLPLKLPCAIMGERANANQPLTMQDLNECGAPKF